MLNPDGVIYGNYRCSLLGFDLNRRWIDPSKHLDPTIYYTKRMMKVFQEEREIKLFCDLHGHSRKKNAFMYGCEYQNESKSDNFMLRIFPSIFQSINKIFKFKQCSFKLEKSKEKTGRIVCFKELGIMYSFTQETSFFGREREEGDPEDIDLHMSIDDFKTIGTDLMKTLSYFDNQEFVYNLEIESLTFKSNKSSIINNESDSTNDNTNIESEISKTISEIKEELPLKDIFKNESKYSKIFVTAVQSFNSRTKSEEFNKDFDPVDGSDSDEDSSDSDDEDTILITQNINKNNEQPAEDIKVEAIEIQAKPQNIYSKRIQKRPSLHQPVLSRKYGNRTTTYSNIKFPYCSEPSDFTEQNKPCNWYQNRESSNQEIDLKLGNSSIINNVNLKINESRRSSAKNKNSIIERLYSGYIGRTYKYSKPYENNYTSKITNKLEERLQHIRQSDQEALKQSSDMRREEYNFLNLIDDMFFYKNQKNESMPSHQDTPEYNRSKPLLNSRKRINEVVISSVNKQIKNKSKLECFENSLIPSLSNTLGSDPNNSWINTKSFIYQITNDRGSLSKPIQAYCGNKPVQNDSSKRAKSSHLVNYRRNYYFAK